ncbi:MAG TPA: protease inhibitor I42 family protein [Candidatus Dormibacteraeota bacterium]|nr:protease inhibitor I42 family protein [Candidatus Dormibacteraeota bacterium]
MIRKIAATIALASFLCAAPALAMQLHATVFVDASQTAMVAAGDDFFIALPSNVTTGYSWTASGFDGKLLAYEGNVYQPPLGGLPGAGGQQIFVFHANRTGTTTVTFNYSRPFDSNAAPAKSATFTVTVQ